MHSSPCAHPFSVSTKIPFKGTSKEYVGEDVTEMFQSVKRALQGECAAAINYILMCALVVYMQLLVCSFTLLVVIQTLTNLNCFVHTPPCTRMHIYLQVAASSCA